MLARRLHIVKDFCASSSDGGGAPWFAAVQQRGRADLFTWLKEWPCLPNLAIEDDRFGSEH